MSRQPTIAIVGAGYAGLTALGRLLELLPSARLILVEPGELHVERARLHRALRGEAVAWRLDECLPRGVCWVRARAIEASANAIRTDRGGRIAADFVIVAAGARPRPTPKNTLPCWDLASMRSIRTRLRHENARAVILGGGLTGIELACALATRMGARGSVELRHRGTALAPTQPAAVRATIERALEKLRIDVRLGTDEPPPKSCVAIAATGVEPARLPGDALHIGDADPDNAARCAQIARLQGLHAAAAIARACGADAEAPQAEPIGQLIDLGAAGATGWIGKGSTRLPLPATAARVGLEAVSLRHRAFLRALRQLG